MVRKGDPNLYAAPITLLLSIDHVADQAVIDRLKNRIDDAVAAMSISDIDAAFNPFIQLAAEVYALERRVHPRDAEIHALLRDVALANGRGRWPDLGRRLSELPGPHWTAVRAVWLAANDRVGPAATTLEPVLASDAAALQCSPLAPFVGALLAQACATDPRLAKRLDVSAVRSLLRPWAGTHAVAGAAVASLGPVDDYLQKLDLLLS